MWEARRAAGFILAAIIVVAVTAIILMVRNRRRIASSLDKAAVDTLAAGVRAKRKLSERASTYRQRILDRAEDR